MFTQSQPTHVSFFIQFVYLILGTRFIRRVWLLVLWPLYSVTTQWQYPCKNLIIFNYNSVYICYSVTLLYVNRCLAIFHHFFLKMKISNWACFWLSVTWTFADHTTLDFIEYLWKKTPISYILQCFSQSVAVVVCWLIACNGESVFEHNTKIFKLHSAGGQYSCTV